MVALQLPDGSYLNLDEGTQILLKKRNPLFHQTVIPLPFSLPFELPIKGNEKALNWQHLHNTQSSVITTPIRLLIYGNQELSGTLHLKRVEDKFECELYATFNGDIKIATLFPDTLDGSVEDDASAINSRVWPYANYCWISYLNDDEYFNATYLHKWVNRHDAGGFTQTSGSGIVPLGVSLYLGYVLKTVCTGLGFTAKGDLFNDPELMTIILWNNYVFRWNGGNWLAPEYLLVPDMTVNQLFLAVRKWIGLRITVDIRYNEIWFDKLNTIRDKANRIDVSNLVQRSIPIEFAFKEGVDLSLDFTDPYNSGATKSLDNIQLTGNIDLSSFLVGSGASAGQYWYCRGDNAIYFINEAGDPEFYSYNYQRVTTQEGEEQISVGTGPLTEFLDYPDVEEQLLPRTDHPISDLTQRNPFGLHLLFFRGMHETAQTANTYPLATAHNLALTTVNPNYVTAGDYSLYPDGDNGTYEKFLKLYDQWISTGKYIDTFLYWGISDWKKFNDRDLLTINSQNYIWVNMDILISLKGIEYVKAKLLKA